MRYIDEFRDGQLAQDLAACIRRDAVRPIKLMEVCGTHTMAIARHGIKSLLPDTVRLISGPGCPVCVTPQSDIDRFIGLGRQPDVTLTSFGDMLRVPGTTTSLETERARGVDVRVVYSPLDAVAFAQEHPERRVIFCGVGFETTTPAVALAVLEAQRSGVTNFFVLCGHKTMPQALIALAGDPEVALDGFICPGHVSAILGSDAYLPIVAAYHIPCVITGFEPLDILQAIWMLVKQINDGHAEVEVQYSRAVLPAGNPAAAACTHTVFEATDADWRGIGVIPGSGLRFRQEFAAFDAAQFLPPLTDTVSTEPSVCACGEILKGRKTPTDCPAFGKGCTPARPLGACMVSSEGSCAAEYRYARR
ncbi:MAG TPA: hydrogenase formation protein HypD [Armatimonadota bacterium]|jgi:hydrogenase expression/formation protein HypD